MHGVIVLLILLYFYFRDLERRKYSNESHKIYLLWEVESLIREIERVYFQKFGINIRIKPATKDTLKETKRAILKIKRDFENNTPNGQPTTSYHSNVSFPRLSPDFDRI